MPFYLLHPRPANAGLQSLSPGWDEIAGKCTSDPAAQEAIIAAAWKSYALGYEVFCEASYEGDTEGVLNAGTEIAKARAQLQAIGQYDA